MIRPRRSSLGLLAPALFVTLSAAASADDSAVPGAAPVAQVWLSTADGSSRLARAPDKVFENESVAGPVIAVDADRRFQTMAGFGAAMTDASAWLLRRRMSESQRQALMQELFGPDSLGLNYLRLTIGASDFSSAHYSLDDMPPGEEDPALGHFSIAPSRVDVIPAVRQALAINPAIQVMASPWSAPAWMKTSGSLIKGSLRPEALGYFAEYLHRYVTAYAAEGITIHALTVQNEPLFEPPDYPGMLMDGRTRARFIGEYLGPLFERQGIKTEIFDYDHNWDRPDSPLRTLVDTAAARYISGVAWHCYAGKPSAQQGVHDAHPDKAAYMTECSGGQWNPEWGKVLGWMTQNLIIGAVRHGARAILLWNLALDEQHGPHLGGCQDCRGVVTIDAATGAVTRNPEYYVLGHASRFVRPGATRIASTTGVADIETVAFRNADDGSRVVIAYNAAAFSRSFVLQAEGRNLSYRLDPGSVATFRWSP